MKKEVVRSLLVAGDNIVDIVHSFPFPAHLKEADTGCYIVSNKINSDMHGFSKPEEMEGLKVDDLALPSEQLNLYIQSVKEKDQLVSCLGKIQDLKSLVLFTRSGLLHFQSMSKVPVFNNAQKIVAIFTYGFDETDKIDRLTVFNLYKKYFNSKKLAAHQLILHFKLEQFFETAPSLSEIEILLTSLEWDKQKNIANKLNITQKTVEFHLSNLKEKFSRGTSLEKIKAYLRGSQLI